MLNQPLMEKLVAMRWQGMVEGLKIVGKLKEPIDWQKVTDVSFLPPDLQARTH